MKKVFTAFFCILPLLFLLSSCNKAPESVMEPFDTQEALQLIQPIDQILFEVGLKDEITREELSAYSEELSAYYLENGPLGPDWPTRVLPELFLDMQAFEDPAKSKFILVESQFCPTIFHEGIEISSSEIEHTYYGEDKSFSRHALRILLTSTSELLADWERTYVFLQDEASEWKLDHMEGTINISGEKNMLPPKED